MPLGDLEKKCDMCNKPLGDKVWTLRGYVYKCCSASCLLYVHLDPQVVSWDYYLKGRGTVDKEV